MAQLILVRHGESLWNKEGKWTGLTDIELSKKGKQEARQAAATLQDTPFDLAYSSALLRAQQTLSEMLTYLGKKDVPITVSDALDERDYGTYTGKNKWEVKKEVGNEQFHKIRRSWDYPIPGGESLQDVYNRVVPYYQKTILPQLQAGHNVIIAAHGNSLRALIKYLEHIADENIASVELGTGEVYLYTIDAQGTVTNKEIKNSQEAL